MLLLVQRRIIPFLRTSPPFFTHHVVAVFEEISGDVRQKILIAAFARCSRDGGVSVSQRRAVGTTHLNMEALQKTSTGSLKNLTHVSM